jgi:hypothetical protein
MTNMKRSVGREYRQNPGWRKTLEEERKMDKLSEEKRQ